MAAKFHISSSGKPEKCTAHKRPCPCGGAESHFDSFSQAQHHSEKLLEKEHNPLRSATKSAPSPADMARKKPAAAPSTVGSAPNPKDMPTHRTGATQGKKNGGNNRRYHNRSNPRARGHNVRNNPNRKPAYFRVVGKNKKLVNFDAHNRTEHVSKDRIARQQFIDSTIEDGKPVAQFVIDKKHRNGNEVHEVWSNGLIKVYNENTKKHITTLIARPRQVSRCYNGVGEDAPQEIVALAMFHTRMGYNEK